MNKPKINITPLIDVLLVLLVIFMVIAPAKPSSFRAKVPASGDSAVPYVHNDNLVVTVRSDESLEINSAEGFGNTAEPDRLIGKLREVFEERTRNGVFRDDSNEIEKTVYLRAPAGISYGSVAKVVDALKTSGADPIALQIDGLPQDK